MARIKVPFNRPYMTGMELEYIRQAHEQGHLSGNGPFTKKCQAFLEREIGCRRALLTHSATAALEMAALLAGIGPGDEVIMPSFTFVSTANAFVLRGGVPVFVDIRPDTLNLDETKVEMAVTPRTKAIVAVHYGGVGCDMGTLGAIARKHKLALIEDAAQGIGALYQGVPLGRHGHLGALSFHETKNLISGEGGALLVNEGSYEDRARIIWEKGTNRSLFLEGQVDKYTWVDVGSSYLPSDILAAFLWAQLEQGHGILERRMAIWETYHRALEQAEAKGWLRRPVVPPDCRHNAHLYYVLLPTPEGRTRLLAGLNAAGIQAIFHYIPLHSSPAGRKFGRAAGPLPVTDDLSARLLRLPLWIGLERSQGEVVERVVREVARVQ